VDLSIESEFKEFLDRNKIDISSLKGTKQEDSFLNAKDKRTVSILKAVGQYFKIIT
jgi:hypothetical protein